jgi:predicted metal-dependent hydrolase
MDGSMQDEVARGIQLFNAGEFFVCHEVLEDIWREERGIRRFFLQSIIHLAVGFYHSGRGNRRGAERQLTKGLKKLAGYLPECEGLDTGLLYRESIECLERIRRGEPTAFPSIQLISGVPGSASNAPIPEQQEVRPR